MSEPFLGEIKVWPMSFAPRYWAFCWGQTLSIAEHSPLYALIGDTYGGDGRSTFKLPDLRGRVPVGMGPGIGIQYPLRLGQYGGSEANELSVDQLPQHNHAATFTGTGTSSSTPVKATVSVHANSGVIDSHSQDSPENAYWSVATTKSGPSNVPVENSYSSKHDVTMASDAVDVTVTGGGGGITGGDVAIGNTGSNKIIENRQPYLGLNYIICMDGLFPPRN